MKKFLPSFRNLSCIFLFFLFSGELALNAQDYALEFDGTNNYVQIDPFESLYDETDLAITVEAWIFPTDLSGRHTVFSTRHGNASNSWQLEVGTGATHSNVVAVTGVSTWVAESEDNAISTNQWTHVAMVYQLDHSSEISNTQIYVNGEKTELQQETDYEFIYNGDPITIGMGTNGGSYFEGKIDEVRVWSEARTQESIQETMMSSPTGDENTLEAYYKMDDGPGTTASDNSLNSNTGHLKPEGNEPSWVADFNSTVNNHALELDGTDDLINLGSPDNLDVSNTLTIEAWVYPTDLSERDVIYSTRSGGSTGCWQLEIGKGNNNTNVVAVTGPGTWVAVSEDNAVVPDQCNHVVFVRNGESDKGAFYVNGREVALQQQTNFTFNDNNDDKTVGNGFKGTIDEVRIWNIARSKEEIRQNMMHPLNGTEPGLVAYHQFGEGSGATTWDISSNANSGSLEGSPQWVNDVFPDEKGTEEDPISIASAYELYWLSVSPNEWDKVFQQTNNIDASNFDAWNLNEGFIPIGNNDATDPVAFSGIYDGQGYGISNLMINRSGSGQNQGLFGCTDNARIKNTNIINADINAYENTGALIGNAVETEVSVCSSSGSVSGTNQTGGLIGIADQNTSVNNSYSVASVNGGDNTGGLTGKSSSSEINHTYSGGTVSGDTNSGGLNGNDDNSTISSSFWNKETSEQETSDGGTGKTTSEMTTQSNFVDAGWDFEGESSNGTDNIWSIHENINSGYPYLSGQTVPPEIKTDEIDVSVSPATVSGDITSLGTSTISEHGICWNTNGTPTVDDNKTSEGETNTPGTFTSEIAGLSDLTTYYVRAYATNEGGTTYGEEKELVVGADFEGVGSEDNPFKIYTLNNLKTIGENSFYLNKHFIQMQDIDADETQNWNNGNGWTPISTFSGVYNGNGFVINNLYVNNEDGYTGLFGKTIGARISNLGLQNVEISSYDFTGALIGEANYGTEITNCFSTGNVSGKYDYNHGWPKVSDKVGGLVGINSNSSAISGCYSTATVSAPGESQRIGGLVGKNESSASINNSYATGNVSGNSSVGGFAGENNESATIQNCYSTGTVSSQNENGFCDFDPYDGITNSFWDTEASGNPTSVGGTGKTTEEMTTQTTFTDANWDFVNETNNRSEDIWDINADFNNGYPYLRNAIYLHQVASNDVSGIAATSATGNGEVTTMGSENITEHGVCWNTTSSPTIDDSKTMEGPITETGGFSSNMAGLSPNTTYYARAYVEDEKRITYGDAISFTTEVKELTIEGSFSVEDKLSDETTSATITNNSLTLSGIIGDDDVSLTNIEAEFEQADPGKDISVSITNAELTGVDAANYSLSLNQAPATTADILEEYQLTLTENPADGGTSTGEGNYVEGTTVAISASPESGFEFINWTDAKDNIVSDQQEYSFSMPSNNEALTANFAVATTADAAEKDGPLVWPNPFDQSINISTVESMKHITIVSESGQVVYEKNNSIPATINTSHLKPGLYIIKLVGEDGKVSLNKMIKQ